MILLIGKRTPNKTPLERGRLPKGNLSLTGFTLIELILTTLIILVVIGLSAPIFKTSFSELRVNLQAKDITAVMNLAKEKAILTRTPHIVRVNTEKNFYRILVLDAKENKPKPLEGKWGRIFRIHSSIKIAASEEQVKFSPDGYSTGLVISLKDTSGTESEINISSLGDINIAKAEAQK